MATAQDPEEPSCMMCGGFAADPRFINGCKHTFCAVCIDSHIEWSVENGEDVSVLALADFQAS